MTARSASRYQARETTYLRRGSSEAAHATGGITRPTVTATRDLPLYNRLAVRQSPIESYFTRAYEYQKRPYTNATLADLHGLITSLRKALPGDTPETGKPQRRKLALLLPGHNEELIIALTIKSAVAAGQPLQDIYVVDDNSNDKTREIAISMLGTANVLSVERSGKALAIKKALAHFEIADKYVWVHVADADSVFSKDYFHVYTQNLDPAKYAVAIGFVQSLRGNWISTYRAISYTYGQQLYRRIQSRLGMISVFPGPVTCFRTDILPYLDFEAKTITEDFDVTLQVHRYKLGGVLFIPKAINYTQDPQTFRDFFKQTQRWHRGFFQCIEKYRIGLHRQRIDVGIGFQLLQTIAFVIQIGVLVPIALWQTHNWNSLIAAVVLDFIVNSAIAIWASFSIKRWNLLGAMPYFYVLRIAELVSYFWSAIEVLVLRKFRQEIKGWATEGRRYALDATALQDIQ